MPSIIDSLDAAIPARINTDIPGLQVCEIYPVVGKKISLPAVLFELDDIEPDEFGGGTFDCWLRYKAYCIYDPMAANAEREVRKLAATVGVRVNQESDFGVDIEKGAEVLFIGEDSFKPELKGYLVWSVEFRIGVTLGENEWLQNPAAGVPVTQVTVGDLNEVNIAHQLVDNQEPSSDDLVVLPEQPKG